MDLWQTANRPLESLWTPRKYAQVRRLRFPHHLVVGRGKSRQARTPFVAGMMPEQRISRRGALIAGAGAFSALVGLPRATAAAGALEEIERHGLSVFGDLKYPADFRHFDYVDPNAPKGGMFSQIGPSGMYNQNLLTFNSLNAFILKGDAAQGMEFTFATLMARALDEPDAV